MARVERQKLWVGHDCRVPRARASLLVPAARGVELRPQPANVVLGRVGHELRQPDGPANGRHRYGRLATRAVREHGQQEDSCDDEALERDLTDATLRVGHEGEQVLRVAHEELRAAVRQSHVRAGVRPHVRRQEDPAPSPRGGGEQHRGAAVEHGRDACCRRRGRQRVGGLGHAREKPAHVDRARAAPCSQQKAGH